MMELDLAAVPNQAFSVQMDAHFYDLAFRDVGGVMAATIARDGVTLISGARVTAGTPLLPYRHQQELGNFVLLTDRDQIPFWDQFGVTQFLRYLSAAEIAALREG